MRQDNRHLRPFREDLWHKVLDAISLYLETEARWNLQFPLEITEREIQEAYYAVQEHFRTEEFLKRKHFFEEKGALVYCIKCQGEEQIQQLLEERGHWSPESRCSLHYYDEFNCQECGNPLAVISCLSEPVQEL